MQPGALRLLARSLRQAHGAVDRQKVEPPVVVEVEPGGAESGVAQALPAHAGPRADVLERASPIVAIERCSLAGQVGDEEILVAVGIEVAGVEAHARFRLAIAVQRRARQQRDIPERAVALVAPELVWRAVVGHVDVDPSVAVEVGGRDCRAPGRKRAARATGW